MVCRICGPKLALCCSIISIWGIIQLVLMGVFFYGRSVALVEDLGLVKDESHKPAFKEFFDEVDHAYDVNAHKCWVAVGCYVVSLVFSVCQLYVNKKSSVQ